MLVIIKIIALAFVIVVCVMLIKQYRPEMALEVEVAGAVVLLAYILDLLKEAFTFFDYVLSVTGLSGELFVVLLKIIGVGYLVEFSANCCQDCGNSSVASKVLLAGKLTIFALSISIMKELIELIVSVMQ